MVLKKINPTETKAWRQLQNHFLEIKDILICHMFDKNPERAKEFSITWEDFFVDYSKNKIDEKTKKLLIDLAQECHLSDAIDKYFKGEAINETENRAVLHTALRDRNHREILVEGKNIIPEIEKVKERMREFSRAVIDGSWRGFTGAEITDIVNIGIGGSDLGPDMACQALKYYKKRLKVHFLNNVDGDNLCETLKDLNQETTLFVIVSKTFTTEETLTNAQSVREWFLKKAEKKDISKHFVAVSTNLEKVREFGISQENVFPMWDWVGGRFSLWSSVGLSLCLFVGYENFEKLLNGANKMDVHFKQEKFENNIPVILALLSIWYNNFWQSESEAVVPYTQYLEKLPPYLQQAVMESNGKSISRDGEKVKYQTEGIVWGGTGTNSQHAFFQLIHQGTKLIPVDFIGFKKPLYGNKQHHNRLMSNFFAQTEALLMGKSKQEVVEQMKDEIDHKEVIPFKVFEGNKPTNSILIDKLTPESLGKLIAMYEHKIFVKGVLWNIFSYDQWGVELGKQMSKKILKDIETGEKGTYDASTQNLVDKYKKS